MNTNEIISALTKDQIRTDLPELKVGNNVKVYQKIVEGNRTRTQMFEGTIIKIQGGGIGATFTARRLSYGVGVEKTWPVNSPNIEKIEVSRLGKVRRAKLYYLRDRVGKAAKVKEKIWFSCYNEYKGTEYVPFCLLLHDLIDKIYDLITFY